MDFSHIVSVGTACRVTYQLRRHFNFGLSFPFDWWVTTPKGVMWALDPAHDPYLLSDLEEVLFPDGGILQIAKKDGSIRLQHDFPRNPGPPGKEPVVTNWWEFIATPRNTLMRRRRRLLELNTAGNRILFVRHSIRDEPADVVALLDALRGLFDRAEVSFLLINSNVPPAADARCITFDTKGGDDWRGDDAAWSAALAGITLDNAALPPFGGHRDMEPERDAQITTASSH